MLVFDTLQLFTEPGCNEQAIVSPGPEQQHGRDALRLPVDQQIELLRGGCGNRAGQGEHPADRHQWNQRDHRRTVNHDQQHQHQPRRDQRQEDIDRLEH